MRLKAFTVNDRIYISDEITPDTDFTEADVEAWIREELDSLAEQSVIRMDIDGQSKYFNPTNIVYLEIVK